MQRGLFVAVLLLFGFGPLSAFAQKAAKKPLERFDGCTLLPSRWNDGDTFRAKLPGGREELFRFYFIDAPETTARPLDRHQDQEAYFGLDHETLKSLAEEASAFTKQALERPFTIYTRWRPVFASNRYYAFVVTADGTNLMEELVSRGLVQIHGPRATTPDGLSSESFATRLIDLEKKAKESGVGGWKR